MNLDLVWVIDTSSLLAIKEQCSPPEARAAYKLMTRLVEEGRLLWPPQVEGELTRYEGDPDEPTEWIQKNRQGSCGPPLDLMPEVMATAGAVQDKKKLEEDADAYVLALAMHMQRTGRKLAW